MTEKVLIIPVPVLMLDSLPYGPAVVSGILKQHGYTSKVWDLNIDLYQHYKVHWQTVVDILGIRAYRPVKDNQISLTHVLSTTRKMLKQKLDEFKPQSILLSVFSNQSLDFVIPFSVMIKQILPNCYVLVGGRGLDNIERVSKMDYGELYQRYLPIDCCYLGDAENNLIKVLQTKTKGVFRSPPVQAEHLENMPPANWEGYDFSKYANNWSNGVRMPITGSKGCVRDCTFCDVAGSWPKFVYRKGKDIGQEIVSAYRKYGIKNFEFTDNLVNGSIKNFREMNTYIAEQEPDVLRYLGYAICRPKNEFPKSDFQLARKAGASLFKVGIESGSESVRHDMKKKFSNQDIDWFAENCYDNGIKQVWLMFVGYPTETEKDFKDSIELLRRHRHLASDGSIMVFLSLPMMLTSGSAFMRKYGEEYGLEHNRQDPWSDFFWTSSKHLDNTFETRLDRWKRFVDAINQYGYATPSTRQAEKFLEIEGLSELYKENYRNGKRVIAISPSSTYINKETHV